MTAVPASSQSAPAGRDAADRELRLGLAQERMWLFQHLRPGDPAYNVVLAVELDGPLAVAALRDAIDELVRRHEPLRTVMPAVDGRAAPRVLPAARARLREVSLAGLDWRRRDAAVETLLRRAAARPFRLADEPPASWWLVALAPERHLLVLAVHHVAFDAGSLAVARRELSVVAAAATAGRPSPLGPLDPPYAAIAAAERERDPGPALERVGARLAGVAEPASPFPDSPPPAGRASVAARTLGGEPPGRLLALAREEGCTPHMVVLAAVAALVGRRSGRDSVVLGVPVSQRESAAAQAVVGPLLNLVPVRVELGGDPSFRALVRRARAAAIEAYEDRHVPFERLAAMSPPHALDRNALFEVVVSGREAIAPFELAGAHALPREVPAAAAKYGLTVTLVESDGSLELGFEADAARSGGPAGAGAIGDQLITVLAHALAEPGIRAGRLPLVAVAKRQRLVEAPPGPAGDGAPMHRQFERRAREWPDAIAVVGAGEQVTYAALDAHGDRLMARLRAGGVGPERRVGVCMRRDPMLVAGLLGILKAGGAYVPLDPAHPADRLRVELAEAAVDLVLCDDSLPAGVRDGVRTVDARALGEETTAAAPDPHPASLCHVLFTSGSTGRPKAVGIEHRSAAAFVRWAAEAFDPAERACVVASSSLSFDLSVFEILATLCAGGTVLLADHPLALARLPDRDRATLLNTVPTAAAALLDVDGLPRSIASVVLAGEALPPALVSRFSEHHPGVTIANCYGPTEATTYATGARLPRGTHDQVTIGRPLPGVRAVVTAGDLEPLPEDVPGELLLGGVGIARGYLGRPGLTAASFVPDPFEPAAGARLYRTGDVVRRAPRGDLRYLGRADDQLKLRGVRIELGEIDAAVRAHPGVAEAAAVVTGGDDPTRRRLVAFAVPGVSGASLDARELLEHLRLRLPPALVPAELVAVERLPRGATGKLDRRALERRADALPVLPAAPIPPRTVLEEAIAAAWRATIGREQVGVHEPFFDAGGDSLGLLVLQARLERNLRARVEIADLFRFPTIALLARHLASGTAADRESLPSTRGSRRRAALARRRGVPLPEAP